ncbi:MAG: serine hydrolase domain-containing protein [Chitinophagaceae bacterium]
MKKTILLYLLMAHTGAFVNAQTPGTKIPDTLKVQLDNYVKTYATEKKCMFITRVSDKNGNFHYSGYDGRTLEPVRDFHTPFEIGSCSKMFTATAVLQLIEKGKLSLDDRLVKVLPNPALYKDLLVFDGKDYIDAVTIRDLLHHSSGFADYFVGTDSLEIVVSADKTLQFTPEQLIRRSKRLNKPSFKPGTGQFKYSNVNYLLLGMIIEKLTGMKYQQYIQTFILKPVGLKQTWFGSVNPPVKQLPGHYKGASVEMPPTMAGAAGEMISTLDDMTRFIRSWYAGKFFRDKTRMETLLKQDYLSMAAGIIDYGLGNLTLNKNAWGHAGQTFGWQSFMGALPNGYSFVFGIDDASVDGWIPALVLTEIIKLSPM